MHQAVITAPATRSDRHTILSELVHDDAAVAAVLERAFAPVRHPVLARAA